MGFRQASELARKGRMRWGRAGGGGGLSMRWSPHIFQQSRAKRRGATGV